MVGPQGVGTWNILWMDTRTQTPFSGTQACLPVWCLPQTSALAPGFPVPHLPPLVPQVAELQDRATAQNQEQAILQRSLEDRAAQVEVERMGAKVGVCGRQGLGRPGEPWVHGPGPRRRALFFIGSFTVPADGAEPRAGSLAPGAAADSGSRGAAEACGQCCQQVCETGWVG